MFQRLGVRRRPFSFPAWMGQPFPAEQVSNAACGWPADLGRLALQIGTQFSWPPVGIPTSQTNQCFPYLGRHGLWVIERSPAVFLQPKIAFLLISFQPLVAGLPADFIAPAQLRQALFLPLPFGDEAPLLVQRLPLFPGQGLLLCPLFRKLRFSRKVSMMFPVQIVSYVAGPDLVSVETAQCRQPVGML
jgi:hypothetical protein